MADISKYPYFSYDDLLDPLLVSIASKAPVRFAGFKRIYSAYEQFLIIPTTDGMWMKTFFAKELYKLAYFNVDFSMLQSGYFMCDSIPSQTSQNLYRYMHNEFGCAHGLGILQKHKTFCDMFMFNSYPENGSVNNFYLNQKHLFTTYIQEFYEKMSHVLQNLVHHKMILPINTSGIKKSSGQNPTKQMTCGELMIKGLTSKEIGRILHLSPRTVEDYINRLKRKYGAKNRAQLTHLLNESFKHNQNFYL